MVNLANPPTKRTMLAFQADMGSNQNNYPTVINIKEALNFIGLTHKEVQNGRTI